MFDSGGVWGKREEVPGVVLEVVSGEGRWWGGGLTSSRLPNDNDVVVIMLLLLTTGVYEG